jgi:hypothetical protein
VLIGVLMSSTACTSVAGNTRGNDAFWDSIDPAPEATVTPPPDAADAAAVPAGFALSVVARQDDPTAAVVLEAITTWAEAHDARAAVHSVGSDDEVEQALLDEAGSTDLVVGVGSAVVDVFSLVTAELLDQRFLVLGAQLPEPTENVTAVIWPGASFRGTGISETGSDAGSGTTPDRAESAVALGVAAILEDHSGIVLQLP